MLATDVTRFENYAAAYRNEGEVNQSDQLALRSVTNADSVVHAPVAAPERSLSILRDLVVKRPEKSDFRTVYRHAEPVNSFRLLAQILKHSSIGQPDVRVVPLFGVPLSGRAHTFQALSIGEYLKNAIGQVIR
jgi:hypothetical protein